MNRRLSIITYHYVRPLEVTRYPEIKGRTVAEFEQQLDLLERKFSVVRMEDVIAAVTGQGEVPDNAALLTFDDGYRDHFDYVFPLLDERGWQGTFFIPMQGVFERRPLDVNKIHYVLAWLPSIEAGLTALWRQVDILRGEYELEPQVAYEARYKKAGRFDGPEVVLFKKLLQVGLPQPVRDRVVSALFDEFVGLPDAVLSEELYMTVDQVRHLQRHGMHIGNHGYAHQWYDAMSEVEQERDITKSLRYLRQIAGNTVSWTMCYPYGASNSATHRILQKNGCALAFSTVGAVTDLAAGERLNLPRLDTNQLEEQVRESVPG